MQNTRESEGRGTLKKFGLFIVLPIAAVAIIGAVVFFAGAFDSTLAENDITGGLDSVQATSLIVDEPSEPELIAAPKHEPTPVPVAEPTDVPVAVSDVHEVEEKVVVKILPEAEFGEVLDEGWIVLDLPAGRSLETWFTLQVDTETQGITNFFALYDDTSQLISTVRVEDYAKGEPLSNAELTLYYGDGTTRLLYFNGQEGTMSVTQHYLQPRGPSMFSADLRVAMVSYGLELSDETGQINALLNLDLTGLSLGEVMILHRPAERVVADMLREIGEFMEQLEDQRGN